MISESKVLTQLAEAMGQRSGHSAAAPVEQVMANLVRDMLSMMQREGEELYTAVNFSTNNLSALQHVNSLRLLKQRLAEEAERLRTQAQERDRHLEQVVSTFQRRVDAVKNQLAAT